MEIKSSYKLQIYFILFILRTHAGLDVVFWGGRIREQTEKVLCKDMSSRGLTDHNTKRNTSNGVELDNTHGYCVKKRLK